MLVKIAIGMLGVVLLVALYHNWHLKRAGLTVTSWYRTPWKNASVGGSKFSQHLIGWAWDVVPTNNAAHDKLRTMGFGTVIRESEHIHVSVI